MMRTSYSGRCFIAQREACVLIAYQDGAHYSIGFGDNDPALTEDSTTTLDAAWARFNENIDRRDKAVNALLKADIAQHEYDCCASLYYQGGNKLRVVADLINAGNKMEAMATLLTFNRDYTHNEFRLGLAKRRLAEAVLFQTADYGDLSVGLKLFNGPPKTTPFVFVPFPAEIVA